MLEGHRDRVEGALALTNGRLLSWSGDKTLRLWDVQNGDCLAALEGHTALPDSAQELADGRLLSWTWWPYHEWRLWDAQSGACLEAVTGVEQAGKSHPDWLHIRQVIYDPGCVVVDFFARAAARTTYLRHKATPFILAAWNANSHSVTRCLLPDGTAVVTQENGQVCILKLQHGSRRVPLAEAEAILAGKRKKGE